MKMQIPRPVEVVRGWENIGKRMGCGVGTIKKWQRDGGPIYFIDGKWTAEMAELWAWVSANYKPSGKKR